MSANTPKRRSLVTKSDMEVRPPAPGGLTRIKPYKAAAPDDTVSDIRSRLAGLGMSFVEKAIRGEEGSFSYCLRLVDEVRSEPVFQTMGKGRTDSYAKASAYGEMIERIQNLAFYMMLMYPSEPETDFSVRKRPFKYYPDEKALTGEELRRGIVRLSRNDPSPYDFLLAKPAIGIPFWNVFSACTEYLPFRALQVIVGSNGMCSGNTPAEALIHGICEVFERHVLKQLFLSPCSPPDVPFEFFAGHGMHEDLNRLAESNNYSVHVKDCSLGLRLPVIGLLIRDQHEGYAFGLGADPSPVTALERCFTEMCQGGRLRFKNAGDLRGASSDVRDSQFWSTQLHLNIRSGEGHWPPAILRQVSDDSFQGFEHPESLSDEHDLDYLLGILRDAGWDLLIRDNSFLGFPSYYVYIPGIGEITNALNNAFAKEHLAFDRQLHVLTNPAGASLVQREEAVRAIDRYAAVAPSRRFCATDFFMHYRQHPLAGMPQDVLQHLLLQPDPLARTLNLPGCFECAFCRCVSCCHYPMLSTVWNRLKKAMNLNTWTQNNLKQIVKGETAVSQLSVPGENSYDDCARLDAVQ